VCRNITSSVLNWAAPYPFLVCIRTSQQWVEHCVECHTYRCHNTPHRSEEDANMPLKSVDRIKLLSWPWWLKALPSQLFLNQPISDKSGILLKAFTEKTWWFAFLCYVAISSFCWRKFQASSKCKQIKSNILHWNAEWRW